MKWAYRFTIEKLPAQPSLRENEPEPLLPDKRPWKRPVMPLVLVKDPLIDPPPLTEPEKLPEERRPPEIVRVAWPPPHGLPALATAH